MQVCIENVRILIHYYRISLLECLPSFSFIGSCILRRKSRCCGENLSRPGVFCAYCPCIVGCCNNNVIGDHLCFSNSRFYLILWTVATLTFDLLYYSACSHYSWTIFIRKLACHEKVMYYYTATKGDNSKFHGINWLARGQLRENAKK